MHVPIIGHHFSDALIEDIRCGPRRECTFVLRKLFRNGQQGAYADHTTLVRFGGITNMDAVTEFFVGEQQKQLALHAIEYASYPVSKIGHLYVNVTFERSDNHIIIQCGNISILEGDEQHAS